MRTSHLIHVFALLLFAARIQSHAAGAKLLSDLNPGAVGSYPSNFTEFGTHVYFSAYSFETGVELWKSDGESVSLAANINPTADDIGFGQFEGNDSFPDWLTLFNGQLYFSAFESRRGAELWRFDGSQAARVSDINADVNDAVKVMPGSSWPRELTVVNDVLYFSAASSTNPQNYELWSFDGVNVELAANIHPDTGADFSSYPTGLTAFSGSLFFMADDGSNGWEIFRRTSTGTFGWNINPGGPESSSFPKYFATFNSELYFQAFHPDFGFELWKIDSGAATLAADLFPGLESSYPEHLTAFDGALYFRGADPIHGSELQRFNGSTATLAADINPSGDSNPKNLTIFGNTLVFAANDGVNGWELWKFDGASATLVTNLNPAADSFPENLTIHNGAVYFTATTPETGYELWMFDGTTVTLAADINQGPGDSFPRALTSAIGHFFFSAAADGTSNWEPWVLEEGEPVPNQPPTIALTSPQAGKTLLAPGTVTLQAEAVDADGSIRQVEFFNGEGSVGIDSSAPFEITLSNLPAGIHSFKATATDDAGASTTSSTVEIVVVDPIRIASISRNGPDIEITASAPAGASVALEASADLASWSTVRTSTSSDGTVTFAEPVAGEMRFFRIVLE